MREVGELAIVLRARDVAVSAAFYEKLGFTPENVERWNTSFALLTYQGTRIALMDFIPQAMLINLEQEHQHQVIALGDQLESEGFEVAPAGAPSFRGRSLQDPDGNTIFIYSDEPVDDSD